MCVCTCVYTYKCVSVQVHAQVHTYVCMPVLGYACVCVFTCVHMSVYEYVAVLYVHTCVWQISVEKLLLGSQLPGFGCQFELP